MHIRFWGPLMKRMFLASHALALPVLLLSFNKALADTSNSLRVVALSGVPAPGAPGTLFGALTSGSPNQNNYGSTPVLNNSGKVSFFAQLQSGIGGVNTNNDQGIWLERNGVLELVAREGDQAPGLPSGANYKSFFFAPSVNTAGKIAFNSILEQGSGGVTSSNDYAVWSDVGGPLHVVVREGDPAPVTPPGSTFGYVLVSSINDSGDFALQAARRSPGDRDGFWIANANGSTSPVVIEGDSAPGLGFNAQFVFLGGMAFSEGQMAFSGQATNASNTINRNGVWASRNGSLQLVAAQDDIAPGSSGTFIGFAYYPQVNNAGRVAFSSYLAGAGPGFQSGIWSDVGGSLQKVAATGDQAPGLAPGVKFNLVGEPVLSDSGRLVFDGNFVQNGSPLGGTIWSYQNGNTVPILLPGDHAPGTPTDDTFLGASQVCINKYGRIAFSGYLKTGVGDVTADNSVGIWAEDSSGQLQLIVRKGDLIDVDNGPGIDLRTIASFSYFGDDGYLGPKIGQQGSFNDLGQFAFVATFTDGSSGIFVSNAAAVPEPCTLAMAGLLLIPATITARRCKRSRCYSGL